MGLGLGNVGGEQFNDGNFLVKDNGVIVRDGVEYCFVIVRIGKSIGLDGKEVRTFHDCSPEQWARVENDVLWWLERQDRKLKADMLIQEQKAELEKVKKRLAELELASKELQRK